MLYDAGCRMPERLVIRELAAIQKCRIMNVELRIDAVSREQYAAGKGPPPSLAVLDDHTVITRILLVHTRLLSRGYYEVFLVDS